MKGFVGLKTDSLDQTTEKPNAVTSNILYTNFESKVDLLEDISEEERTKYKKEVANAVETAVGQ